MAIVWGSVARSGLRFVAIIAAVGWREWLEPHRLHLATLMKIIRTGVTISVAGIATLLQRRGDNLLVSVFFGNATMGAYNFAYNLADTPVNVSSPAARARDSQRKRSLRISIRSGT
jgi:O-antigen/teichoic acid export membrane protein